MPTNDLEVFDHLCSEEDTRSEIDFLAFAVFAHKKRHWISRFSEINKRPPNHDDIDAWITQLTDYDFRAMRGESAEFFHEAATNYMEDDIKAATEEGKNTALVQSVSDLRREIRIIGRWRTQLITALGTAILVPIILGGAILCLKAFEDYMPTAFRIGGQAAAIGLPAAPPPSSAPPK
jgi:hypothetical protein